MIQLAEKERQGQIINGSPSTLGLLAFDLVEGFIEHPEMNGLKPLNLPIMDEDHGERTLLLKVGVNPYKKPEEEGITYSGAFITTGLYSKDHVGKETIYLGYMGKDTWTSRQPDFEDKFTGRSREFNDTLVVLGWDYIYGEDRKASTANSRYEQYDKMKSMYYEFEEALNK